MRILFVHQNFPGQYRHIINVLAKQNVHQIVGLGIEPLSASVPENVFYCRYGLSRGNTDGIHPWLIETESKLLRGESCARVARDLYNKGFYPDLIACHPGWGEALFLKDIWPKSAILTYQEFYYNRNGFDYGFDPEFFTDNNWEDSAKLRMKNANVLLSLQLSDWCITPTPFQRSSFPINWQPSISCIHDGIDTSIAVPAPSGFSAIIPNVGHLKKGEPVITFVNRSLEPYRGCHTFIRSIPYIQKLIPGAKIVIVGTTTGTSYGALPSNSLNSWKDVFLEEIDDEYDPTSVFFTGSLDYQSYLQLLRVSACHVYLTYPFVLSWSLLEAMSVGLPIVASRTAPVLDLICDKHNGLLVDFFSATDLAEAVSCLVNDKQLAESLGYHARQTILDEYSLDKCIPRQLSLMELVSSRSIVR